MGWSCVKGTRPSSIVCVGCGATVPEEQAAVAAAMAAAGGAGGVALPLPAAARKLPAGGTGEIHMIRA